jgi:ferric-dicitrate binding protein FerR (iron transport regulator)
MNLVQRWLIRLHGRSAPNRGEEQSWSRVDDILDRRIAGVKDADPETARMWQRLGAELERNPVPSAPVSRPVSVRVLRPAMAFAILVVVIVAGTLWLNRPAPVIYATSRGDQATISLPDSSVVTLNHMSSLTVDPSGNRQVRHVSLNGEAYFRVHKDGSPFIVSTALGAVTVLGTEFNVFVRDSRLEVAVLSGTVRMSAERSGRDSSVILHPGEIAACEAGGFPEIPVPIPFPAYPGWMHGRFIFYRTPLLAACREVESQFGVTVTLGNRRLTEETITGAVDNSSVGAALSALARLTGSRYRYENGVYTVY